MRLAFASIKSLFNFSSANQQAASYITSQSSPSDITMPVPSSTDPQDCVDTGSPSSALVASEPFEPHTLESSASAGLRNMTTGLLDSQDAQGLAISSSSDGKKRSTQATDDRKISAESKKRSKRKAKKANAQGQGSQVPAVSPDILPLGYCGSMPAPSTTSPKPNLGPPSVSSPLAYAEPTKAVENLRKDIEKLRQELEEANRLTKGLKESHSRLEEEIESWKQKCEVFSEMVKDHRNEVEGMINSRLSSFFDKVEQGKEKERRDKEEKKEEGEVKGRKEKQRRWKEGKAEEGKEKKRKQKEWKEKREKEGGREEERGKAEEAKLKAKQEKSQKCCFEQIQTYRQCEKAKEKRRKTWWNRLQIKSSHTSWRRVFFKLLLLHLFILVLGSIFLLGINEIRAYNRAHARRVARLKLKESGKVQLAKAVVQFVADLSPEPIRGTLYNLYLNGGWNLDDPYW